MQFSEFAFDQRIVNTLAHLNFESPTDIQRQAIPVAMVGRDIMASSKTGSGKTLAYLLPCVQRLLKQKALSKQDARAIVLCPTRELAKQVYGQLRLLIANTSLKSALICGGENFNDQLKTLRKDPQIIIATAGRLHDHLQKRHLFLEGLELLILDEADRMFDLGFSGQLQDIHKAANHRKRQTLMFSATMDNPEVGKFAQQLLKNPVRIAIGFAFEQHTDIEQRFYLSEDLNQKQQQLQALLSEDHVQQAIVFTATRVDTERLATHYQGLGFSCAALSGDLNQSQRNQIMDSFSRGHQKVLFTTDLASRGLDIVQVSHVVNFDMPKHSEEYMHRIGRTGRAGNQGHAHSLIGPNDWNNFDILRQYLPQTVVFSSIDGIESRFTGLRAKNDTQTSQANKPTPKTVKTKANGKNTGAKRNRNFHEGQDIGDIPIRRRAAPEDLSLDGDDED
ncbi:DEAD/DEAH box helicase [Alginatibacterium sediminis]|uniref:DEAD/DEAH box helicase n=1 Tax=Alginatibacterium sediminis TaxID=2164068 RepID=A0A420EDZ1_9ALTE|nr:DEAD/DEAH box helicase [Alginatibacterium sediminis]RKF18852.1 DEAD/DEAH box helicase [Alginatibacterium sediminis]